MASRSERVLITGARGFTGQHLTRWLVDAGYKVYGLVREPARRETEIQGDLTVCEALLTALKTIQPDYIVHLAAISFVPHGNIAEIYQTNLFGTLSLLDAVLAADLRPRKILIASSANVYGNPSVQVIDESVCPAPVNHYANSKLAMEYMVRTYFDRLRIIITRPFNYTGIWQAEHFLIPKIVKHYKEKCSTIELGNLEVVRDFSDVRFVVEAYQKLLECEDHSSLVNICSGQGVALTYIIDMMNTIAGYEIEVRINPAFVRSSEVKYLVGSNRKLFSLIGRLPVIPIYDILSTLYSGTRAST